MREFRIDSSRSRPVCYPLGYYPTDLGKNKLLFAVPVDSGPMTVERPPLSFDLGVTVGGNTNHWAATEIRPVMFACGAARRSWLPRLPDAGGGSPQVAVWVDTDDALHILIAVAR
jgi:hypothetical protein